MMEESIRPFDPGLAGVSGSIETLVESGPKGPGLSDKPGDDGLPGVQAILGKPDEPTDLPRPVGPPGEPNIVVNNKLGPIGMPGSARLLEMSKMYTDRTKELFTGLIDRPLLTDQLLQRPPFRFLHDIVKITIQNTGFLMNNFTNEEMDVSTITDKTAKASFLKTLIKALNDDGSLKNVKVGKIIAGKEPEMTNLMLQKLAIDAAAYRDSKLKDTAKEEKQKKEKKAHKKEQNNKGVERKTNHNESRKVERDKRHSSKSKEKRKKESENKPMIIKQTVDNNKRKDSTDEGHFKDVAPETSPVKMEQMIHTDQEPAATTKTEDSVIVDNIINETEQPLVSPALREQPRLSTSSGRPRTSLSRLGTAAARPAPPKIKKKRVEEIERKPEIRISSQIDHEIIFSFFACMNIAQLNRRIVATAVSLRTPNYSTALSIRYEAVKFILKSDQPAPYRSQFPTIDVRIFQLINRFAVGQNIKTSGLIVGERKQSDEYFIVQDEPLYDQTDQTNADELIIEEHGSLVRKILETKKGLEDQISKEAYNAAISVFDENDQAKSQQELADLQKTMQQITQTTHLFARFLDNAQEDAESMFKEMEDWRLESTKNLRDLQERKANAEGTSENLLLRLNQLDEQIKEVKNAIVQTKAKVIANEDKIRILVNNI
ncbi:unnamed protein product [Onchocerca ochengi]|uniref:MIP-T3 domain-containing protein n=1 Tax=Onchocerca ochengi TaxID=42157 RepID=A0A182DYA4_ONCOC|nr:unnamed protein product [Onchocerca ochengi]